MANPTPAADGAEALLNLSTGGARPSTLAPTAAPPQSTTTAPPLPSLSLPPPKPPSHMPSTLYANPPLPPTLPSALPHISPPLPYLPPHLPAHALPHPQQLDARPSHPLPHLDWREYPLPGYEQLPAVSSAHTAWEPDTQAYPIWQQFPYSHPYYYYPAPAPAPAPQLRYPRLRLPVDPRLPLTTLPEHSIPPLKSSYPENSLLDRLPREPTKTSTEPESDSLASKGRAPGLADLMNPADNSPGADDPPNGAVIAEPSPSSPNNSQPTAPLPPLTALPSAKTEPNAATEAVKTEPARSDQSGSKPNKSEQDQLEDTLGKEPKEETDSAKKTEGVTDVKDEKFEHDLNSKQVASPKIDSAMKNVESSPEDKMDGETGTKDAQLDNKARREPSEEDDPNESAADASEDDDDGEDELDADAGSAEEDGEDSVDQDDACNDSEITRCPCKSTANSSFMVACDQCNTWQHSKCMGFRRTSEVPQEYYCNICRPEEMRITCIAHPKYKERHNAQRDGKERRDSDVALAAVRPAELRKLFAADLKQKRLGIKLSRSETYQRYAALSRNQYAKHRSSIIEGLSVLLDQNRSDVTDKLDNTLRRMRSSSGDALTDGASERRRGTSVPSSEALAEPSNSRSHGHRNQGSGRGNTQKRARPQSLSLEQFEVQARADASMPEISGEIDTSGSDMATARGMSREERKLQQTMKLFARMEEREREKKKPRTVDAGSSPKATHPGRPKTPRVSSQLRNAPSPKALSTPPRDEPSEQKAKSTKVETRQQQQHNQRSVGSSSKSETEPARETSRREREHRIRERPERVPTRRKDSCALDNTNIVSNRRRGLLERERSNEGKRRRVSNVSRDTEKKANTNKEQAKRDPSLDFKLYVPGPSVLGSRKISKSRLSRLDREFIAEEESTRLESEGRLTLRSNKKYWLLASAEAAEGDCELPDTAPAPMKKRFKALPISHCSLDENNGTGSTLESEENREDIKESTVSVSMVVVSEKGSLPDNGEILESSRLILPSVKCEDKLKLKENPRTQGCLKKRKCMFSNDSGQQPDFKPDKPSLPSQTNSARANRSTTPASPCRSSPPPASPLSSSHSLVSPLPVSPQRRSPKPVPAVPSRSSESPSPSTTAGNTVSHKGVATYPALASPASPTPHPASPVPKSSAPIQAQSPRLRSSPMPLKSSPPPSSPYHRNPTPVPKSGSALQSPNTTERISPNLIPPQASKPISSPLHSVKQSPKQSPKPVLKENPKPPALELPNAKLSPTLRKSPVQSPTSKAASPSITLSSPSLDKNKQPNSKSKVGLAKIPLSRPVPRSVSKPLGPPGSGEDKTGQQSGLSASKMPAPSKPALPALVIPLSKPKPIRAANDGELPSSQPSSAKGQFGSEARKSPTSLGFRGIRSVPLSQVRKTDGKTKEITRRQSSNTSSDDVAVASPPSAEAKTVPASSSSATISDIFQQRLQGFLNPTPSNSGDHSAVGKQVKAPVGLNSKVGSGENSRTINRSSPRRGTNGPHGLSSYRNKSSDSLWRGLPSSGTTEPHSAPPFHSSSSGAPPSVSLPHINGRTTTGIGGEGGRYNGNRLGPLSGRDEKGRNNTSHNRTWNNYLQKNGWGQGSGMDHHSGNGVGRGNRRGRH